MTLLYHHKDPHAINKYIILIMYTQVTPGHSFHECWIVFICRYTKDTETKCKYYSIWHIFYLEHTESKIHRRLCLLIAAVIFLKQCHISKHHIINYFIYLYPKVVKKVLNILCQPLKNIASSSLSCRMHIEDSEITLKIGSIHLPKDVFVADNACLKWRKKKLTKKC